MIKRKTINVKDIYTIPSVEFNSGAHTFVLRIESDKYSIRLHMKFYMIAWIAGRLHHVIQMVREKVDYAANAMRGQS